MNNIFFIAYVPIILLILIFGTAAYFGMSQHPEPHKTAPRGRLAPNLLDRRHQQRAIRQKRRQRLFLQFLLNKQREEATKKHTQLKRQNTRSR
jgi:hypothetical protein